MASFIKITDNTKFCGKVIFRAGPLPIDYDTILLEDESGYVTQELSGQIALELQEN
jgi:hypothetical protein